MASNFFNKASLVMVPDAPIDGKLPSVKPEDRSGDFTFSRGSNLAATRVNKGGLIEKGRENLLLQSNQFDTTWTLPNASVTSGQEGYDGSNDAWLLNKVNSDGYLRQNVSGSLNTFSIYAKKGTLDWVRLGSTTFTLVGAFFDLSNGVVGSSNNLISSKIESIGNGWYRCSITLDSNPNSVRVFPADSDGVTSGTSGNIYIQDAQLELGLVATGYIETTTATVQKGILENLPRIDYSGGASCPSLLLEPQRSQLITQSEYFGSATWNKQNSIGVNTNSHLSPEGIQNATELDGFDSSNFQSVAQYITLSAGTYTFSVFLKKTTGALNHYPAVVMGSVYKYVIVNSTTGTYAESTGTNNNDSVTIESWDDNWWRVSLTNTLSAGAQRFAIYPALSANGTFITTNASGTNVFWGAQVEVGSYPTSYIPAYGSSVTRSQDIGTQLNFSNFFDGYDFTMFLELKDNDSLVRANSSNNFRISDTGGNNFGAIRIYRSSASSTRHRVVFQDNSQNFNPSSVLVDGDNPKIAVRRIYNTGEFKVFVNGVLELTATNTDYDMFRFIDFAGGGSSMNIKQIALFGTALTDDECIALTTI